jgi:5'-3' exonuclease
LDYKEVKDIINKIDEKEIFKNRNFLINLINQANIQNAQKSHFMNKIINIENTVTIDINKNKNIFIKNI